ncbi:MAG: hypothetical protein ACXV3F_08220 [Frankiaceae bacterium]
MSEAYNVGIVQRSTSISHSAQGLVLAGGRLTKKSRRPAADDADP